jgi:hypothetical protein
MKYFFTALYFCFYISVFSQENSITPKKIITQTLVADQFWGYDTFGYIYYTKDRVFIKEKGQEKFEYKNLAFGKIDVVDLQNPLNIVLFFESFNALVTLDNQLNEITRINFSEWQEPIVLSALGLASQNRFWGYNTLSQRIVLIDYLKRRITAIAPPFRENMQYYQSNFNHFHWINTEGEWYSCDLFGKIIKNGQIPPFEQCYISPQNTAIVLFKNQLYLIDPKQKYPIILNIDEKRIQNFTFKDQILTIFTAQDIIQFNISNP